MADIGSLTATLGVDTRGLNKAEKSLKSFESNTTKTFSRIAKTAGAAFSIVAIKSFVQKASAAYEIQRQAEAKLKAVIEATGGAAGKTAEQLFKEASALQRVTNFGDEAIIGMQAIIATFKNIKGDEFSRTATAVLDMATVMGTDARSAAVQLAKALNDPIANLGALGKAGVQFTKTQKEVIKTLWETGRTADAQRIILNELESQFGGTAKATVFWGTQLSNVLGDVLEWIGSLLNRGLEPLGRSLINIANMVLDNSEKIEAFFIPAIKAAVFALKLLAIHFSIKGITLFATGLLNVSKAMLTLRTATLAAAQAGRLLGRVFLYGTILEGITLVISKWNQFNKLIKETPATWGTVGRLATDQFVNAIINGIITLGHGINNVLRVVTDPMVEAFWQVGKSIPDLLFRRTTIAEVSSRAAQAAASAFDIALSKVGKDFSTDMSRRLVKIASDADLALLQKITAPEVGLPTIPEMPTMPSIPGAEISLPDIPQKISKEESERLRLLEEFNREVNEIGLSQLEIERQRLAKRMNMFKQAGADRIELEKLTSSKLNEIALKEQQIKLSFYQNIAGQIAGTFQQIAQAGGKQSKTAFLIYKAFAMAQAGIAGSMAYVKTLAEPALPWPGNVAMANVIAGMTAVQVGMIAGAQPPSFDNGGVSTKEGLFHAGDIQEAHIPLKGGRVPIDMGEGEKAPERSPGNLIVQTFDAQSLRSYLRDNKKILVEVMQEAQGLNEGR